MSASEDGNSVSGSEVEAADSDDADGVDASEPWNAAGIQNWELVPAGGRAKCCFCNGPFKPADSGIRLDYRFKVSNSLRDQNRFHSACASNLPEGTRARDIRVFKRWLKDPAIEEAVKLQLRECLVLITA